jgi:hypothetical protein
MKVYPDHFNKIFDDLSPYVVQRIMDYKFEHRLATAEERDDAILGMIRAIYHHELPVSGPARHPIWEAGWAENLKAFDPTKAGRELAKPRYHGKYPIVRWNGDLYVPESEDYEHNMLAVIQDWVFDKYLRNSDMVCEFGCGTGHNLFRVGDVNSNVTLVGLDWATSAVQFINLQAQAGAYSPNLAWAHGFDFFNPSLTFTPSKNCAFVTVASLEQVGSKWKPFFDFVMAIQPKVVIHIEPIEEVLDDRCLLDHLSREYFRKRGYLTGWLRHLQAAEKLGKAEIHRVARTFIGSKFIEGYTVIVWSPRR